jgi:hypothetical protein
MKQKNNKQNPVELQARNAGGTKQVRHGPEPDRFKIEGYANWEDAVKVALRKKKPKGGWPKR